MMNDLTFQTTNELWQECVVDSSIKTVYKVSVERLTYTSVADPGEGPGVNLPQKSSTVLSEPEFGPPPPPLQIKNL